jgi:DNA-binding CsgD family transcriptional regulator
MQSTLSHSPDAADAFLRAAEAAQLIASPQQLFLWLRLHLYRFVPHELALLRWDAGRQAGRRVLVLNSVPLPSGLEDELGHPADRLWAALVQACGTSERAQWFELEAPVFAGLAAAARLSETGFTHMLVQVHRGAGDDLQVAFLRQRANDEAASEAIRFALDLWMPYLRFAVARAQGSDHGASSKRVLQGRAEGPPRRALTERELQVLCGVREAKANAQIATMLGISPLTVKNHLRSIQKKLGARNRAHAVAEAMSMRLIS